MTQLDFTAPLQQVDRVFVRSAGRKLLYFGGCDYYRLSSHSKVLAVIPRSIEQYGLSTAASRKTTGNHRLYPQVESALCNFFGVPSAVLVSSGYLANIAFAQALRGRIDTIFLDERAHESLRDAARVAGSAVVEFRHRDLKDLARQLRNRAQRTRLAIVTDGMFASDGSLAPLAAYRSVAGPEALLWVDDAHAAGVLGARGRGSIEHAGMARRNVVQTVTFSKAFGVYGGAVLCSKSWRDALVADSSAVSGNTPLPLPFASAILTALGLIAPLRRAKLFRNVRLFWQTFGHDAPAELSPIIAMTGGAAVSARLLAAGIYPTWIQYPGGPAEGYFRFALSSEHTPAQVRQLADTLRSFGATVAT